MQYVRLTVIGSARKADVSLPAEQPLEELLPELIDIIRERVAPGAPLKLTTLLGTPLETSKSLAAQNIASGAVLRLASVDQVPQAPLVAEVTEAVAEESAGRKDRWTSTLTHIAVATAIALFASLSGWVSFTNPITGVSLTAVLFVFAVVLGTLAARAERTFAAAAFFGFSVGIAAPLAMNLALLVIGGPLMLMFIALWWALSWGSIAAVYAFGANKKSLYLGAAASGASGLIAFLTGALGWSLTVACGIAGIVTVIALSFVPALSLSAAGVTRFDEKVIDGGSAKRTDVVKAVENAFTSSTALTLSLCVTLLACVFGLVLADSRWTLGLALTILVFMLTRSRLFPLAVPRAALLLSVAVPVGIWLFIPNPEYATAKQVIAIVLCVILVALAQVHVPQARRAQFRKFLGFVEGLSVVLMLPLFMGAIGLYNDMLETFG